MDAMNADVIETTDKVVFEQGSAVNWGFFFSEKAEKIQCQEEKGHLG